MASVALAAAGPSSSQVSQQSLLLHVKDSLEYSAASHSCRGKIRLHVLFSTPRIAKDLYPFAHVDTGNTSSKRALHPIEAYVEHIIMTASYTEEGQEQGRLMYALECFLYTLPKHKSSLLYVSKLDSSGWGPTTIPKHLQATLLGSNGQGDASWDSSTSITRVITKAFLSYFASLSHWSSNSLPDVRHVSIHILARAQGAYLFPNSNDNQGKHILSDGALIKWWRSVMSSVICDVRRRASIDAQAFYIIPGYDRLESHELLPLPPSRPAHVEPKKVLPTDSQVLAEARWRYGHPYSLKGAQTDTSLPPLPLSGPSFSIRSNEEFDSSRIAMLLPYFPDDPKSRFIVELARDSYEHAAMPKRKAENEEGKSKVKKAKVGGPEDAVSGVGADEDKTSRSSSKAVNSLMLKAIRETKALDAVSPDEFWQRMGFRQECCAGNAVGVFVCLFTSAKAAKGEERVALDTARGIMSKQSLALHHPLIPDLVRKHLMRDACDWSLAEGSRELTRAWNEAVERAVRRKGGMDHAKSNVEEGDEIARDIIYSDVIMQGATQEEVDAAQDKWRTNSASVIIGNAADATATAVPVNTLNVKRRKKI